MLISEKALKEFIKLYAEESGEILSADEATRSRVKLDRALSPAHATDAERAGSDGRPEAVP